LSVHMVYDEVTCRAQHNAGLQVLMFSATLHSDEVKDVAAKICQKPIVVDLKVLSMSRLQP